MYITIVELPEFDKNAANLLDETEKSQLIFHLATHPKAGVLIPGSGGIRKLRWAQKGKGKSGGVRIIYFFHNEDTPLFLLTIFSKSRKVNINAVEKKELSKLSKQLIDTYKRKKK